MITVVVEMREEAARASATWTASLATIDCSDELIQFQVMADVSQGLVSVPPLGCCHFEFAVDDISKPLGFYDPVSA